MTDKKSTRNSPRRILEIIEAICQNPQSANASHLSKALDIPAPTVYRWLDTLCDEGFISAHASGYYVPGERFRNMMLTSLQYEPKVTERRSILRSLSEKLNETVSLSVPHGTKLIYFDRMESHWPFQVNLKVGAPLPLHCCASGKLYLSTLDPKVALNIYKKIAEVKSARNTIVDSDKFIKELTQIRNSGFSIDNEEWFDDMVGSAVPIFDDNGTMIASLSTHALATRKSIENLQNEIPLLTIAAKELKSCLVS